MPHPLKRPRRRPPPTRREQRIAASEALRFALVSNEPDRYPNPPDPDDDPNKVVPFMALEWQYVSVFLITPSHTVLLFLMDDIRAQDPQVWSEPRGKHHRVPDVRECAAQRLYADTGINFPPARLEVIDDCVVSLAGFGGNTNHAFVVAEWTEADGPMPWIGPPVGATACRFFSIDDLPMMDLPYARRLIETRLRR